MTEKWPVRWDLLTRYRMIEVIALWEGRLTTRHLCSTFGIGRQQASKDINTYLQDIAPENLIYDKHLKGYKPAPGFAPAVTQGTADEYLQLLTRNQDISRTFEDIDLGFNHTETLQVPLRHIKPHIIQALVQASRDKKRVEIDYISLTTPVQETRVIAPHTLVCTGLRWHVRAYCEKNRDYRDFVLSRFRGEPELLTDSENDKEGDHSWNKVINIKITPDPRLSKEQKQVIARDYGMSRNCLMIKTRGATAKYMLQTLNIDPKKIEIKPEAQQIIVENIEDIQAHLY
ncbi:WYL domain-containing protein [Gammaproteobacteria bacterium 42_54_T18]|nr:WYL domain-containing protein [Gammaproteobacteria bacterium 42_54_T18]